MEGNKSSSHCLLCRGEGWVKWPGRVKWSTGIFHSEWCCCLLVSFRSHATRDSSLLRRRQWKMTDCFRVVNENVTLLPFECITKALITPIICRWYVYCIFLGIALIFHYKSGYFLGVKLGEWGLQLRLM